MKKEGIIELIGKEKGPTSIILAGIHGDERCGVEAFKELLPYLKIKRGRVLFGYGNPKAIEKNVRLTKSNLNRMFKQSNLISKNDKNGYEYKRAKFLKKYLNRADILLDIHASYTKRSKPFIICEKNAFDITKKLPFNLVVSGFDKLHPGGTDSYMNKKNKIGICIECGYLGDKKSIKIAKDSILAFLSIMKHIDFKNRLYQKSYIKMETIYITKTHNFKLMKNFKDFEKIKQGQIIGIDGNKKIKAKKDGIILFAVNKEKVNEEGFLLGK